MKAKLIAAVISAALTAGMVGPAVAGDPWHERSEWRRQQQLERQRGWEHQRNFDRDRAHDRKRGMDRQRARDKEQYQYWQERDQEYKYGLPRTR